MKKRILKTVTAILFIIFIAGALTVGAENRAPQVLINGVQVEFDVLPVIEEGRTLIPIRTVSEKMGYAVEWDGTAERVEIKNGNDTLELYIGKESYIKNGTQKQADTFARIKDGRTLVPLRLIAEEFGCTVRWLSDEYTAEIVKHETVRVSNAKELLEAIGSYKRIILSKGEYNLSEVDKTENDCVAAIDVHDGTEYSVLGVKDIIIEGEAGKTATVVAKPRYANVLSFGQCEHITLKNLTAGHSIEPGFCLGGVVRVDGCTDVSMEGLHLYGCGTYGVIADSSTGINVKNTEIYECTYGLTEISYSQNIIFDNCVFRDSGEYDMFSINESSDIGIINSSVKNNKSGVYSTFIGAYDSNNVYFRDCEFENNGFFEFTTADVRFENCKGIKN